MSSYPGHCAGESNSASQLIQVIHYTSKWRANETSAELRRSFAMEKPATGNLIFSLLPFHSLLSAFLVYGRVALNYIYASLDPFQKNNAFPLFCVLFFN